MARNALLLSVNSQHLIIHATPGTAAGDQSVDLPFMLRPELLHKADLAELFAQKLGERLPDSLPRTGPVCIVLPLDWGSVLLELPLEGIAGLENPLSHLEWELERNAPESAHTYLMDYQEFADTRVRMVAIRRPVEDFLRRSFGALGYDPITFEIVDLKGQRWPFDPAHARELLEQRSTERWKPVSTMAWLLPVILMVAAGAAGIGWWLGQDPGNDSGSEVATNRAGTVPADSLRADSLAAAQAAVTRETSAARTPGPEGDSERWTLLLQKLASGEPRLPGFVALHEEGILLDGTVDLASLLAPFGVRPTHAGTEARWYSYEHPFSPSPSPQPRHFRLANLADLGDSLPAPVDRVLLSRHTGGGWSVAVQP